MVVAVDSGGVNEAGSLSLFDYFFRNVWFVVRVQWRCSRQWVVCLTEERSVIQSIYKGVEIELEMHQQTEGYWKCDTMLITRPGREVTRIKGRVQLPTLKLAKEYALEEARAVIDDAEAQRVSVHRAGLTPEFGWR